MITRLEINGFRNHRSTVLDFERFSVIAGPNGVGKSNALRALMEFQEPRYISNGIPGINLLNNEVEVPDPLNEDVFMLSGNQNGSSWRAGKGLGRGIEFRWKDGDSNIDKNLFRNWSLLKPQTNDLSPSYTEEIPPVLGADGSNLASVIANMMTADPESFEEMMKFFREIIPQVKRIRSTKEKVTKIRKKKVTVNKRDVFYDDDEEFIGDGLRFDMESEKDIRASDISDGTLIVLVLLTSIFQSKRPRLLLIDDLEAGLHPSAQEQLIGQIRKIQDLFPELQIIATTHSPYILNEFSPKEIILMSPDEDGYCSAKRLSEHPNSDRMLKVLSTGEFWSSEGESWVLEKQQKSA